MPDNIIFSDDEALGYVQQLENPNKVGWDKKNRVWRTPKQKGYDKNQIAYGLDTRKEHNPIVYNFLKLNGRLSDPWLTDKEAKQLMALTWDMKKATMSKIIDKTGGNMSLRGYNVAAGMIWHGHPAKMMLTEDSVTGKAFNKAIASGDRDLNSVFDAYYNYGSNATQFADRIKLDEPFRGNIKQIRTRDGNKILKFPVPEQKPFESTWKPEPPVKTIYPLNNTTPEPISSWSGADAPNATPRLKDLLEVRQEDLNRGIDVYGDPVSPFSLRLRLPSLTSLLQLNSPEELAKQYFADALGISDMLPLTPSLFPRLKNGKLPKYEDGKPNLFDNILHPLNMIRSRLYNNVFPYSYDGIFDRARYALLKNDQSDSDKAAEMSYMMQFGTPELIDDLWGTYLQIPDSQRNFDRVLGISKYAPSNAKNPNTTYYTIPFNDETRNHIVRHGLIYGNDRNAPKLLNPDLGNYSTGVGRDKNGDYVSYYDIWDLNPFRGITSITNKYADKLHLDKVDDMSAGIGKPVEIYDRIYLDDYYGLKGGDRGGRYIPEIIVKPKNSKSSEQEDESETWKSEYKDGKSPIHIKPANRGKFTRLKKRTGHSASWFKAHGTPVLKKMATFALNARKWKH